MVILKRDESITSSAGNVCSVNMWFKDVLQNKTSIFRALESKCGTVSFQFYPLGNSFNFFHNISELAVWNDKLQRKQINTLVTYAQKHNISFNHNNKQGTRTTGKRYTAVPLSNHNIIIKIYETDYRLNAYAIMGSCNQRTSLNFIKYTETKIKKKKKITWTERNI